MLCESAVPARNAHTQAAPAIDSVYRYCAQRRQGVRTFCSHACTQIIQCVLNIYPPTNRILSEYLYTAFTRAPSLHTVSMNEGMYGSRLTAVIFSKDWVESELSLLERAASMQRLQKGNNIY